MSWKKISITVVMLGLLFALLIPTTAVAQTELHVGPGHPFTSIQAAVDAASEGYTIIVHADTEPYSEVVVIDTNNLTLIGDGAILDGTAYQNVTDGLIDISPGVYGVTVEGFEIQNLIFGDHGGDGIFIRPNSHGNTIRNNTVHDVNGAGVFLGEGSYNNLVSENYVFGCGNGIGALGSHDNQIIGNITEANTLGIFMGLGCSDNLVSNNEDNGSIEAGISIGGSFNNQILGNEVAGAFEGIQVGEDELGDGCDGNLIIGNVINVGGNGVNIWSSQNNQVIENKISSGGESIVLVSATGNIISLNKIINGKVGIVLELSDNNQISENKVTMIGKVGIFLVNSDSNTVTENKVNESGNSGIGAVGTSADNLIKGNKVLDSGEFDLFSESVGALNDWEDNKYKTSNFS